jgi:TPR repeat protein
MSGDNLKVPSQVFRWFEKMKSNYETHILSVLNKFENLTESQQLRVDKSNTLHIDNLKSSHQEQIELLKDNNQQLLADINYYKQQIDQQQKSILQLNTRYDTVMSCLLTDKKKDIDIKDIFSDEVFVNLDYQQHKPAVIADSNTIEELSTDNQDIEEQISMSNQDLFEQAITLRASDQLKQAFTLFEQASLKGHVKSMGAMGRAYFLAEGIEENSTLGLAWLVKAANSGLPQAMTRVQQFQENDPELYQQATTIAENINHN